MIGILRTDFNDEEYRYAYDEEFSNAKMATQIKVIREQREMTQAQLASQADMKQTRIAVLENVNYSSWTISTLRRLSRALGVRFVFGFESWGQLLPEIEGFSKDSLQKPKFEDDPIFNPEMAQTPLANAHTELPPASQDTDTTQGGRVLVFPTSPSTPQIAIQATEDTQQYLPGITPPLRLAYGRRKRARLMTEQSALPDSSAVGSISGVPALRATWGNEINQLTKIV